MARHRFTDRWIQACPLPASGRREYVDAHCPSLWLRVTPRGRKTFSALLRRGQRLHRHTIGAYPAWTLSAARDEVRRLVRQYDAVLVPAVATETTVPESSMAYAELVGAYLERHLKPNVRSWENIHRDLSHPALRGLRDRDIRSVTKGDLIAALDAIMATGKTQSALNIHGKLKMLFNWAYDRDLITANPCDRLRRPAKPVERDRVLSDAEIVALWKATLNLPVPYGAMYRMLMLTGQRRTEVATMRWSDVTDALWTIPRERVKKDRAHSVPLSATAVATLKSLPRFAEDGFVFSTTGGKTHSSNFSKIKAEADRLSGVTGWRLHDIRRTVRTKLAQLGVPLEVARKVTNHEDGKIDRTYNRHSYMAEKREALEKWETHLMGLVAREGRVRLSDQN